MLKNQSDVQRDSVSCKSPSKNPLYRNFAIKLKETNKVFRSQLILAFTLGGCVLIHAFPGCVLPSPPLWTKCDVKSPPSPCNKLWQNRKSGQNPPPPQHTKNNPPSLKLSLVSLFERECLKPQMAKARSKTPVRHVLEWDRGFPNF